jgi:hypothetical protein
MPNVDCPHCRSSQVRWLPETSQLAVVNYYRCDECGHVWCVSKEQPDGPPIDVTRKPTISEPRWRVES